MDDSSGIYLASRRWTNKDCYRLWGNGKQLLAIVEATGTYDGNPTSFLAWGGVVRSRSGLLQGKEGRCVSTRFLPPIQSESSWALVFDPVKRQAIARSIWRAARNPAPLRLSALRLGGPTPPSPPSEMASRTW
jgi:hypothetical protein